MITYKKIQFLFASVMFIFVAMCTGLLLMPHTASAALPPPGDPVLATSSDSGVLGDHITNIQTPSFVVACLATTTPMSVQLLVAGQLNGNPSPCDDQTHLATVTTSSLPGSGTPYSITAQQTDGQNTSSPSGAYTLLVDTTAPINEDVVLGGVNFYKNSPNNIRINPSVSSQGSSSDSVWLALLNTTNFATGTNMTITDGSSNNINVPTDEGVYYLYVVDVAGNISAPSMHTVTVDNTAPANQDSVFATSTSAHGGTSVTIAPSSSVGGLANDAVWFAVSGTTHFAPSGTSTVAGGSASSILAPNTEGSYQLFVRDATGNTSSSSIAILTVDNTAPTITVSNIAISDDTGISSSDFITNVSSQTITATLSATPDVTDTVYGSVDNGATYTNITSMVNGTAIVWSNATLASGTNTIKFKVVDLAGNADVMATTQSYTLDSSVPGTPTATPGAANYRGIPSITLASTGSTSIHYTTDGTTPTCTSGLTDNPVSIAFSGTLNVIACNDSGGYSTASFPFTIIKSGGAGGSGNSSGAGSSLTIAPATSSGNSSSVVPPVVPVTQNSTPQTNLQGTVTTNLSDPVFLAEQAIMTVTANLHLGSTSPDVKFLQSFLATQDKGPKAEALAKIIAKYGTTIYYRTLTRDAMMEWQQAVGVVPANGKFGPITRAKISNLYSS